MTFNEAVKVHFKYNHEARRMLLKIIKWDSKKTLPQNAKHLDISQSGAHKLAQKFKLKYKLHDRSFNGDFNRRRLLFKCKCGKMCDGTLPNKVCSECFEDKIYEKV